MKRTSSRPLPSGRMEATSARDFGVGLSAASVLVMGLAIGWLAAVILAISIVYYAVVYTVWLKPRTPQNIVIGGGAGAFPPLIGWVAANSDPGTYGERTVYLFPKETLVLGPLMEENLRRALLISRGDPMVFITRPISAAFLVATVLLLAFMIVPSFRKKREEAVAESAVL